MPKAPQHETQELAAPEKKAPEAELAGGEGAKSEEAPGGKKEAEKDGAAGKKKDEKAQFQILADAGAYYAGIPATAEVGHAWVRVVSGDKQTSWGFWPAGKIPTDLKGSVAGTVHSPDEAHSPTAMHSYEIDAAHAEKVTEAAEAVKKSPPDYNLFNYNCVSFATQMAHAAGVAPPNFRGILGIANPHALAAGLAALNKTKGEDAMERPLPPGDQQT